jgi:chorismate synthase
MSATLGRTVKMTIFGESHGPAIGLVVDGLPPGLKVDTDFLQSELERRAPGRNKLGTARKETDAFVLQSGVFEGHTTGTPLCALIPNGDQHSGDYQLLQAKMRPGHADYAGRVKYHGFNDYRGGGHFSGRLTAPLVLLGALCKLALQERQVTVGSHIVNIGAATDRRFNPLGEPPAVLASLRQQTLPTLDEAVGAAMEQEILTARAQGDSVGGSIECLIQGLPAGVGAPFFDSCESCLAHALFAVPAVKGLEFGAGFGFCRLHGSEANDAMHYEQGQVRTLTNHNGGLTGGLTNGMPIVFRVGIKPTPSISKPQQTVDILAKTDTTLSVPGRHDPCIVQRAVPVIEGVAAWVALDLLLANT